MARRSSSKRRSSRAPARRRPPGFTLAEVLIVLGLTALLAIPLSWIVHGGSVAGLGSAERSARAALYAGLVDRICADIRAARSAERWSSSGIEIALAGGDVRYGASSGGVYRASRASGGSWSPDPENPLLSWDEPGRLDFDFDTNGLVAVDLEAEGIHFRTAVLPRGAGGYGVAGGGAGGNGDEGKNEGKGKGKGGRGR